MIKFRPFAQKISSCSAFSLSCVFPRETAIRQLRHSRVLFSTVKSQVRVKMTANILSGKEVSGDIRKKLQEEVSKIRVDNPAFVAGLAIVQVGDREDSNVYIRQKLKAAEEVGITAEHIKVSAAKTQEEVLAILDKLNNDTNVHGIIVQLPLESDHPMDAHLVTNYISPLKDVDGLHGENAGRLAQGDLDHCIVPCTPRGSLELIKRSGIEIKGKRAVVIGRSKIVGAPMGLLLMWNHATVTMCHSRTVDIHEVVKTADILVVAIGKPHFVKGDWIKPGAVVIDCGINSIEDSTRASGRRLVGDVDYAQAKEVASWITPVPGGVGPMTVAMLMKNTVDGAVRAAARTTDATTQDDVSSSIASR